MRLLLLLLASLALGACTEPFDPEIQRSGLGDFNLDRLVVIVDDPTSSIVSRSVTDEQLKTAVTDAVDARMRRFKGDGSYSIGIKVQGYVLAPPGIPVLFAPRSTLFLSVNAYDSVPQRLNGETRNLTIWEDAGGDTVVGSGYSQDAQSQLDELASNAAIEIERWLRENEDWFGGAAARPENRTETGTSPENSAGGA
ncbi:hypothetical protein [Meridianimarinicoccus aquatilis]|uniref:DUF4410 domain-containing protein n=1 Tax=Meridianimarinicoccus aquatilis TaxID=2552766 RepID=A0A4R6B5D5_9RHOB|nr:hypothetical protein [Fluviibacterium aquatile]QIE41301.1 hypothetical protein G5B39_04625 [Rhodobacteraceae bacterium SC52]TDL90643.1 hypothetical protein E2L05_05010 [Fluviibacterium aquatile]